MLYSLSLLAGIYLVWRLIWPLRRPRWVRLLLCALVLILINKYVVYRLVGGSFFAPDFPYWLILFTAWAYNVLALLTGMCLLVELGCRLGNWLGWRARRLSGRVSLVCLLMALLLGSYGTWQGIKLPEVVEHPLTLAHWPAELNGFRIVQLTDLHLGKSANIDWLTQVVARTNAAKPDLILLTGDIVDGSVDDLAPLIKQLQGLQARYGIYLVPGNHEYYSGFRDWMRCFTALGFHPLLNEKVRLPLPAGSINLIGVTDLAARQYQEEGPDLRNLLPDPTAFNILLSHQPRLAAHFAVSRADLMLSGHTHGGMAVGLSALVALFNGGWVNGWYRIANMQLFISPGTGVWIGFPFRLGVPSEISLLTLHAPD